MAQAFEPGSRAVATAASTRRNADPVAIATIVIVAVIGIAFSWILPWWIMKAQAPQYGQRTLVVMVSPRTVAGDVREVDLLGHYVGIAPMDALAKLERTLAPVAVLGTVVGVLVAPWLRRRWMRFIALLPAMLFPVVVLADLKWWMTKTVNERNPEASLSMTVSKIEPRLFGEYSVGQFKVATELGSGFYAAGTGALLCFGLVFARPLRRRRRATAAALAAIACVLGPAGADAAQLVARAEPGALANAIATAAPGDTVVAASGVHAGRLSIDKPLHLIGRPGAVIDGGGRGTVLRISASDVEVHGITIRASGSSYTLEDAGIRIENAADVHVAGVVVEDTLFGIFVSQGDRCVIEGSRVVGKDLPHVRRGDGIRLWYSSGCRLSRNHVERSRDVIIWYSSDTTVEDNVVRTSRYGLHYMYSDRNAFHRNRFEDNQVGAAIMYSRDVELTENAFSFSSGPSAYGLLLKDADDIFIIGNRFISNATALFLDNAPQSRDGKVDVRGNLLARNDVGIALQPLSQSIRFWENAFIGNGMHVQVLGSGMADANRWAVEGRGNYWSDAVVYDPNRDGISEIAYRLESTYEALADRYPALAFFDSSPAAEAIDVASRLFPIFAPRPKLTDPHPLTTPPLSPWTRTAVAEEGANIALVGAGLLAIASLLTLSGKVVLS